MSSPFVPPFPDSGLTDLALRHRRVALVGPTGSGLTSRLIAHHRRLLARDVRSETILALVGAPDLGRWRVGEPGGPAVAAITFQAWLRRELATFWPMIEAAGQLPPREPVARDRQVDFASSALARYRMATETAELRRQGNWDGHLRARPAAQVAQLLDTHAFSVDHGLTPEEAAERLSASGVASERVKRCRGQVGEAIALYRSWALRHRVLDAALQREVYLRCLWPLPAYQDILTDRVKHLMVDDWTLTTPLAQSIVAVLAERAETVVVAGAVDQDFAGADGADPAGAHRLTASWHRHTLEQPTAPEVLVSLGTVLKEALSGQAVSPLDPGERLACRMNFSSRSEMLTAALQDLRGLVAVGVRPGEIALIVPTADRFALWFLTSELRRQGLPYRLASAAPLNEVVGVQVLLAIARRVYDGHWRAVSPQRIQAVAEHVLGMNPLLAASLASALLDGRPEPDQLGEWLSTAPTPLDHLLRSAHQTLWAPRRGAADQEAIEQVTTYAAEFHACVGLREGWALEETGARGLEWLDSGTLFAPSDQKEGILITAGYAYARSGAPVDFQLWLDLGSTAWQWPLRRELFDPTLLSRDEAEALDSPEAEAARTRERLGSAWRTTLLKARKAVRWYASDLDEEGREQVSEIPALYERLLGASYVGLGTP